MRAVETDRSRPAFTLVELLVVLAIIAMLISMILPGLNAARENSRRLQCEARLQHLILAMQAFASATEHFPAGVTNPEGPIVNRSSVQDQHHSWIAQLLPYLDEPVRFAQVDPAVSIYDQQHDEVRESLLSAVICPSAPSSKNGSSYAGCHNDVEAPIDADNMGVLFLNSQLTQDDIHDGLAYTLFLGEKRIGSANDLGWLSGTRATLRNAGTPLNRTVEPLPTLPVAPEEAELSDDDVDVAAEAELVAQSEAGNDDDKAETEGETATPETDPTEQIAAKADSAPAAPGDQLYVGGFSSWHPGNVHMAMGDGRVVFMDAAIDPKLLQQMGHRSDGSLIDQPE